MLFQHAQALDDASLETYAKEVGLNVPKWKEAIKSPKLEETIKKDQALAASLGATGTPAFFINGRKLTGAQPIDSFKAIIDEELTKAEELVKSGVKPDQVYARIMEKAVSNPAPARPSPSAPSAGSARKIDFPADAPILGPKNAKVTIVEWSDFQCPYCSRAIPTLKQVEEKYPKDVRVVFRHQPLPFHNNAKPAAEASMAAHEQGKFWPYHDKLFANQGQLDRASLEKYAGEVGLNLVKFKAALDSGKFRSRVEADSAAGTAAGANGTPTFFINGRQLVGAQPFESFKSVIDEELAKANKLIASGVKPEQVYAKLMAEAASAPPPAAPEPAAPPPVQNVQVGSAPVKGAASAPITIVEFSDFQCPFCSRVVPTLKQIEDEYRGKVRVAFKHQPLPFHQHAKLAASASMAANEQGKFWEYHDKLFAHQQELDRTSLEKYAQEVGLNMGKFRAALDSNKFDPQISADSAEGTRLGANGTPTFFINGRQLVGAQPFESFKSVIDEELKKQGR
jgi:protein-disulfide isomerase